MIADAQIDQLKLVRCPRSLAPTLVTLPSMSLIPFAPLKLVRCPRSLAPTLVTLPSMKHKCGSHLIPFAPLKLARLLACSVLPLSLMPVRLGPFYLVRPLRSIVSRLPPQRSTATSRLYRPCRSSHSLHCISAAPAALDRYLAALPAMSLIPFAPFRLSEQC